MPGKRVTRRDFLKFVGVAAGNLFLAGVGGLGYGLTIEPGWWQVAQLQIRLPRLGESFSGFRLLQISDIHLGGWMTRERLRAVIQLVLAQAPDLVVITGDNVIGNDPQVDLESTFEELSETLQLLTCKHTTLGVLGNHDHWAGAERVRAALKAGGLVDVSNGVFTVQEGSDILHIAGVDDIWEGKDRLDQVLDLTPTEGAAILLAHEPDFADHSARVGRFDLQLSGHSHGGQVVLPFLGPPITPYLGRKFPSGLYRVRDMLQYTNRGVGMISPAIRLNCRPEITVFTLGSA